MTIDQPLRQPQAQAFHEAAALMREHRYAAQSEILEEQLEDLRGLAAVVKEVAWQFSEHNILDPAAMEAYRKAAYIPLPAFMPISAAVILLTPLEQKIANVQMLRDI